MLLLVLLSAALYDHHCVNILRLAKRRGSGSLEFGYYYHVLGIASELGRDDYKVA